LWPVPVRAELVDVTHCFANTGLGEILPSTSKSELTKPNLAGKTIYLVISYILIFNQ